jgi:hypothetical protein
MGGDTPGVPLGRYRSFGPRMAVEFRCRACDVWFEVPLEDVIARLQARGVGGPETGVREVGALAERPCRCGSLRFATRPAFPR